MSRRIILAALALVWLAAAAPEQRRIVLAATPIARLDLPWWRARFEKKAAELRKAPIDLVFYGDSITEDYERAGPEPWRDFAPIWQHYYGARHAINLGFKGDTTASLLWRITHGEASGIAPKVAVVLIGANNLGRLHWSAEDTIAGIAADVAALRERLPKTRILLLGILPSDRSAWASATTIVVNHALAERYRAASMVTFLDLSGVFMKNGALDRSLFLDPLLTPPEPPLHPNAEGQRRMAAAMEPTLARLLAQ
ncbi:MAG: GDSL-type esterase/lipase family protein [Acidibrevibacterium sp.]|uniref:GDSL-type esterase/lipase family protein n=1 Tax=Acidibrevibacterium fodinaquatile TaxID=1969806 RepID=UPI0023A878CE|nr:GDSL-type esterase/lipase family protein [Acidibrevibacterium fodinaquatile]MCA7120029.1 GDSL-type esterase/lipase family protein [Acidibrevibacterium fodinaquatile]